MTLERRKLSATTLACAAALAGFDADAQPARAAPDCGGDGATMGEVVRVIDGKSFLLADGREVRLAAVETLSLVPGDEDDARVAAALAAKAALESAVLHREVTLRLGGANIFLGIKTRKMLADDFRSCISLQALSSEIPAIDAALGIQHEDCVILNSLYQQTESLFAGAQRSLVFENFHFLLQLGDGTQALVIAEKHVISHRIDGGMFFTNFSELFAVLFVVKALEGISASQGEGMLLRQNVP